MGKTLTVADFPPRQQQYTAATKHYLIHHHLSVYPFTKLSTAYPTDRGICYVMTGPVLAFQERITVKSSPLRYWSPSGTPLGRVLYAPRPIAMSDAVIFIVEGPTDAVAIHQSGCAAVALIGAEIADEQILLLRALALPTRKLVLIPDNDEAGERTVQRLQRELPLAIRHLPSQYKDVCDMPADYRLSFVCGVK